MPAVETLSPPVSTEAQGVVACERCVARSARAWRRTITVLVAAMSLVPLLGFAGAEAFAAVMMGGAVDTRAEGAVSFIATVVWAFWWQLGLVAAAACVLGVVFRRWAWVGPALVGAGIGLGPWAWSLVRPAPAGLGPGETAITVFSSNVLFGIADPARVADEARLAGADIISLQEVTPASVAGLRAALGAEWPHALVEARERGTGQAVFSRWPCRADPPAERLETEWPQTRAVVSTPAGEVTFWVMHPTSPMGPGPMREQDRIVRYVARHVHADNEPRTILAGDFNCAANGLSVRRLRLAGVRSAWATAGRGRGVSWPLMGWVRWSGGTRIDDVMHGPGLRCLQTGVGGDVGSDHRPVWARLAVR